MYNSHNLTNNADNKLQYCNLFYVYIYSEWKWQVAENENRIENRIKFRARFLFENHGDFLDFPVVFKLIIIYNVNNVVYSDSTHYKNKNINNYITHFSRTRLHQLFGSSSVIRSRC